MAYNFQTRHELFLNNISEPAKDDSREMFHPSCIFEQFTPVIPITFFSTCIPVDENVVNEIIEVPKKQKNLSIVFRFPWFTEPGEGVIILADVSLAVVKNEKRKKHRKKSGHPSEKPFFLLRTLH